MTTHSDIKTEFERFIAFGQVLDKPTRRYFVAYLQHKINPLSTDFVPLKQGYFKEFQKAMDILFDNPELKHIFETHEKLGQQIALDILYWFRKTMQKIAQKHPFEEEETELESWGVRPMHVFLKTWNAMVQKMELYYSANELNAGFYRKKFKELIHSDDLAHYNQTQIDDIDRVYTDALGAWDARLQAKILSYQLKHLQNHIQDFEGLLSEKVSQFTKLNQLITPFANYAGNYWDMSQSLWENSSFETLQHYNELLTDETALQALADKLGKMRQAEIELNETTFEKITVHRSLVRDPNLRSEISGTQFSNSLPDLLSSEVALLSHPDLESAFLKQYAEGKLQTKAYDDWVEIDNPKNETEIYRHQKLKEKGPFIVCVDTSGSMEGDAERIAKVLCFAIMKMAAKDQRKAFLINFSSGVKTINLLNISESIDALAKFLSFSFHGGTDISLALHEALNQLQEHDYKEADVLVVSDFLLYKIEADIVSRMQHQQQHKGSRFYSLIISDEYSTQVIDHFDEAWMYHPEEKNIIKHIHANLEQVRNRVI